jgi:hypothetical protein
VRTILIIALVAAVLGLAAPVAEGESFLPHIYKAQPTVNGTVPRPTPVPQPLQPGATVVLRSLRIRVQSIYRTPDLAGQPPPQGGEFLIVLAEATNQGLAADFVTRVDLDIRDSLGRQSAMLPLEYQWLVEEVYHREIVYFDIQPAQSVDLVFVYEIASDSTGLLLVPLLWSR